MPPDSVAKHQEIQDYVGWNAEDARRIHIAADLILAGAEQVVDDFYSEIKRHDAARGVITGGEEQIDRLKSTLRQWLRLLVTGPYDRDYLVARLNVGRRHVTIGLDQVYANAALARMRWRLTRLLGATWNLDPKELAPTLEALHKRLDLDSIIIQDAYQAEYLAQQQSLSKENLQLRTALDRSQPAWEIVGESTAMKSVYRLIERAGPTDKPILIQGESGTGKELVARALHRASLAADKPLVAVNCAALPETLLESELFGHEKGAFTGAVVSKPGLFEVADGGTLFIDEIGELEGGLQAKLLRVLEDGMLRRVGSIREQQVNVRIIAATNRDLAKEVEQGRFREDLYYRINVLRIHLPPLRERFGDIPLLVEHFAEDGWTWDQRLLQVLEGYGWPGNVRQLANALDRAMILSDDDCLQVENLPPEIVRSSQQSAVSPGGGDGDLDSVNRRHVCETLARCDNNKTRTARALGVSRRTLYRLLEKYGIDPQ
ncbi:Nitrogen fixation protein VnfA [Posidoniimonas corsicana]|uniref:Nitrogen fixation protein VnfA n=1 Tax=Posidoniimonas corsicana TaxID=1938618 RepID=A0A5C5VJN3_9BACT|nr:sigma 54-interacting transcriptional regulator [Posidoniimonas corsicana]TWT38167.1 Nitrogen fixation protein VnfA [Posidoniimonas corsicana]